LEDNNYILRPGITNPTLWYPERPPDAEWRQIRQIAMERENWTCIYCGHRALKWMNGHHIGDSGIHTPENIAPVCVACHAVLHIGRSLVKRIVEVWECELSQVEVVQFTRSGVKNGLALSEIKKQLPIRRGTYQPTSTQYANDLIQNIGEAHRAYLAQPLCAVFVHLDNWQLEA